MIQFTEQRNGNRPMLQVERVPKTGGLSRKFSSTAIGIGFPSFDFLGWWVFSINKSNTYKKSATLFAKGGL